MGSGILQCPINGPAIDGSDGIVKMAYILLIRLRRTSVLYEPEATIPLFHFLGEFEIPDICILSFGCKNFETFN
jgi:hypothetical protein